MKNKKLILLLCVASTFFLTTMVKPALAIEDEIIAVVDNQAITLQDLKDYISSIYRTMKMSNAYSDAEIKQTMADVQKTGLEHLIDDRLILNAAEKMGIKAKTEAIDQKMDAIKKKYPSEQAFIDALTADGMTISELRNTIAKQLKSQYFVNTQIKSQIKINPQDVTDFYNQHPNKFKTPDSVDLASIYIPINDDRDAAKEKADQAYKLITGGASFSKVAKKYSAAPFIGRVERGQMKKKIEDKIFNLKQGEVTAPIENEQGFYIFKLKKYFPQQTVDLEDAKDQIAQYLFNQAFQKKMKDWLKKEKEKTYIEIKDY